MMKGIVLVYLLFTLHIEGKSHLCKIRNLRADCSFRNLHDVPSLEGNIIGLDLTGNKIDTLRNNSFKLLRNLRYLLLDKNNVSIIHEHAFAGLSKLKKLTLSRNVINVTDDYFHRPIFKYTPLLEHLDLSKNVRTKKPAIAESVYPDTNLGNLKNLRELKIDLYPIPIFGSGFENLKKLQILDFSRCFVQILKNDTFQHFENITCLSMRTCPIYGDEFNRRIPTMEFGVFKHFRFLRRLDVSKSAFTFPVLMESLQSLQDREMEVLNLYNVNPRVLMWIDDKQYFVKVTTHMTRFYKNMCVNHINIGKNGLAEVAPGTLFSMKNLTCLKSYILSENNFMLVFPKELWNIRSFLAESINLVAIDFSYMLIQSPSPKLFPVPPSYEGCLNSDDEEETALTPSTHFATKDISFISNGTVNIPCPPTLKSVRFTNVIIPFYVEFSANFQNCSKLDLVDFSSNPIHQFDFRFDGIKDTKTVNLSGLDCSSMEKQFMNSFKNVKHLVLRNGNLDRAFEIENYFLSELCEMQTLDISLNHLLELNPNSLCPMNHLHSINLSTNSFVQFPSVLKEFPNLVFVDLTYNRISEINVHLTQWLEQHFQRRPNFRLLLKGNIFACTCDNVRFIKWVYETRVNVVDREDYYCTLKNGKRLKMVEVYNNLDIYFGKCQTKAVMTFGIFGLSFMGLALFMLMLVYRCRWRIVYFIYRKLKINRPLNRNMFDFDAYIAYAGTDYKWICEILQPKLEDEHNLKLCLHDREFIIGETIRQNIVDYIQKSRKVVFYITPQYLRANSCEFELEMAIMEMFQRRTPEALTVIVRGLNPEFMPRCISNIWNCVTCVMFPENENDVEAHLTFWSRLNYAIAQ